MKCSIYLSFLIFSTLLMTLPLNPSEQVISHQPQSVFPAENAYRARTRAIQLRCLVQEPQGTSCPFSHANTTPLSLTFIIIRETSQHDRGDFIYMDTKIIGRVRGAAVLAFDWHDSRPWGQNYDTESRTKTCTCRVTFSAICAKNNANKQDEQSGKSAKYELMSPHRRAKNLKQTKYIILAGVDEKCKTCGSCEQILMQHHYKRSLGKIGTGSGAGHTSVKQAKPKSSEMFICHKQTLLMRFVSQKWIVVNI